MKQMEIENGLSDTGMTTNFALVKSRTIFTALTQRAESNINSHLSSSAVPSLHHVNDQACSQRPHISVSKRK